MVRITVPHAEYSVEGEDVLCVAAMGRVAPPVPWLLASSESEDSIDIQRIQYSYACVFFLSAARTSHRDSTYCTLSFNCVQVQPLPTAQVTSALTYSFFVGL